MKLHLVIFSLIVLALAGCRGSAGSLAPSAATEGIVPSPLQPTSWASPQAAQSPSLLYVGNASYVNIYTYNNGVAGSLVGQLQGIPDLQGMCTDRAGDVWVAQGKPNDITEYPHGRATPIAAINRAYGHGVGCAVNPINGDLAVVDNYTPKGGLLYGSVVIYANAQKSGAREYMNSTGLAWAYFLAYDDTGSLYMDGYGCYYNSCNGDANALMVLKPGGSTFNPVTISGANIQNPRGLSWVKPTLLIGDSSYGSSDESVGYKLLVTKNTAKVVQAISYTGTSQFWGSSVRAKDIIVPDYTNSVVRTYSLANGSLISTLKKGLSRPFSAVVSQTGK
jgi:hypothetical protein